MRVTYMIMFVLLQWFLIFLLFASKFKFLPKFYYNVRFSKVLWWILFLFSCFTVFYLFNQEDVQLPEEVIDWWVLIPWTIILFLFSCFMLFGSRIKALRGLRQKIDNMKIFGFDGVLSFLVPYYLLPVLFIFSQDPKN